MPHAYDGGLTEIRPGTFAYLRPPGTWGWSNSGLIADGGDALLVDAAYTLELTAKMLAEIHAALPAARIARAVLTHGNGDHCYGVPALGEVELIATGACAETIEHEVSAETLSTLIAHGPEPLRGYLARHFGAFDFTGAILPAPDRAVTGRSALRVGTREVELIEVGPAHSEGDLAVYVPDVKTLFAGDIVFAHDTPIAWSSAQGMVAACLTLRETGAELVVPGHGPVVEAGYLDVARSYFEHVLDHAQRLGQAGLAYHEAAARIPLERYADWALPERVVLSTAAAYRDLGLPVHDGPLEILTRLAAFADLSRGTAG
jgi:glyoxylase-like metal-dependent hydrolase (beta-lactamase superfamily II)